MLKQIIFVSLIGAIKRSEKKPSKLDVHPVLSHRSIFAWPAKQFFEIANNVIFF